MEWYWILLIVLGSATVLFVLSYIFYRQFFKRIWDLILSFIALLLLLPIYFILSIIGAIAMRGNPFFTQTRPGKNEKLFKLIKFRSMSNKKDVNGILLPDNKRLNAYGKFIRKTSLDELPEIINIFLGDMSIIGPRPLLIEYLDWYYPREKKRHFVRPGLTGLAQVNGRNNLNWDARLEYDAKYVETYSLLLDISIFVKTIFNVLKRKDVNVVTESEGNLADIRSRTKK